jgi:hypothetical protein
MTISFVVIALAIPLAFGQAAPPAQAAEKTFQGQLTKVDATAKMITVKGAQQEMTFEYTDTTQVVGSEKTVQGLSGKAAEVRVNYREAGGKNQATRIEQIEKK